MRIRTIKPAFWDNEELAQISSDAALLAIGLLNYADDEGYFNANPALVKAAIFPIRETKEIPALLRELSDIKYIELFIGQDNKSYGKVNTFLEHQYINKPSPSKISGLYLIPKSYDITTVVVSAGKEGKGKEGKGVDIGIYIEKYQTVLNKKILKISAQRKKVLESFAKIYTLEQFIEALMKVKESNFLQNEWNAWDIDWICKEENFIKIMENKYINKSLSKSIKSDSRISASFDSSDPDFMNKAYGG